MLELIFTNNDNDNDNTNYKKKRLLHYELNQNH